MDAVDHRAADVFFCVLRIDRHGLIAEGIVWRAARLGVLLCMQPQHTSL